MSNAIAHFFHTHGFGGIVIYYDGPCGFCKHAVYSFVKYGLLSESTCTPAQDVPAMRVLMEQHDSWVVVDRRGVPHFEFDAGIALMRASPVLFWLAPFIHIIIPSSIGHALYRFVADHRPRTCVVPD
ncbi:MAG: DCC1-like thiol-disulfide oxidoreductase family protein [Patescibacteria group bacterium]